MTDALQNRANERKIYEEVVNIIVDFVNHEYGDNQEARLRIYGMIAENFSGMVRALSTSPESSVMQNLEETGEPENE